VRVGDDARARSPAQPVGSEDHALVDADAVHDARERVEPAGAACAYVGALAVRSDEVERRPSASTR
jgi:hypothetical protein